jgi:chromosome segregation ATPase
MKRRGFVRFFVIGLSLAALGAAGLVYASNRAGGLMLGKRIGRALEKAGVDEARIESILTQAKSHRAELISMWRERRAAMQALSEMSPEQADEVRGKVQALFEMSARNRETLKAYVEEAGSQLTAREKANLVLQVAGRFSKLQGACGSRIEGLIDRLEDSEALSAADISTIQSELEKAAPELCGLRDALRADLQKLREAVAAKDTTDATLETVLGRMKQTHESVSKLRTETLQSLAVQLSPASQIAIAGNLVRLHRAAAILLEM